MILMITNKVYESLLCCLLERLVFEAMWKHREKYRKLFKYEGLGMADLVRCMTFNHEKYRFESCCSN